jgi:acetyl esterase/lipase
MFLICNFSTVKSWNNYNPTLMKSISGILLSFSVFLLTIMNINCSAQLPGELPLWPNGIRDNPVKYKQEKMRTDNVRKTSLSQLNRVFSCVSTPTYIIHKPEKGKSTGVAVVICPGGGFRDVWFDREGNDFGLWLAGKGITSLVLKYRTFNADAEGFKMTRSEYAPHVYADARQAIYTLRSKAGELNIDVNKIGIAGYSAGGSLALTAVLEMNENELPGYAIFKQVSAKPDFAGLFYPGLNSELLTFAGKKESLPPVFIINGGEDKTTPADNCIELYKILSAKHVSTELHIYAKGGHGFDSGIDRGSGVSMWQDSFIAWLKDTGFIK